MSNIINIYIAGGPAYMHPVTILLIVNIAITGYIIYNKTLSKNISPKWLESIKHIGGFAAAVGTFGTLVGLFMAFNALEHSEQVIPFQVIMGGLKVALINVLYGLIVFLISMVCYIVLKLRQPGNASVTA
jgi:MotA/TolQ/ExbB proton channel family